jgi:hypothetical protein
MPTTLKSRFPQIAAELAPRVSRAVRRGADEVADTARQNLESNDSVDSGDLLNAIHVKNLPGEAATYAVIAGGGSDGVNSALSGSASSVYYGHFVEYGTENKDGTRRTSPKPFLVPALEEKRHSVALEVQDVLRTL